MPRPTLSRIKTPGTDRELKSLLTAWVEAVERYVALCEKQDNPWWLNERASISVLAGAAWSLAGWSALEEYSAHKRIKRTPGEENQETTRNGRADLFIINRKTTYAIEAKQAWQSIGQKSDGTSRSFQKMKDAWNDSADIMGDHANRRFAATFIVPSLPLLDLKADDPEADVDQELLMEYLNDWLGQMGNFARPKGKEPAFAYVFPEVGNRHFNTYTRHFPGVVLVLEERYRAG